MRMKWIGWWVYCFQAKRRFSDEEKDNKIANLAFFLLLIKIILLLLASWCLFTCKFVQKLLPLLFSFFFTACKLWWEKKKMCTICSYHCKRWCVIWIWKSNQSPAKQGPYCGWIIYKFAGKRRRRKSFWEAWGWWKKIKKKDNNNSLHLFSDEPDL